MSVQCLAIGLVGLFSSKTALTSSATLTVHESLGHFTEDETAEAWFQQDSTTRHRAQVTMRELSLLFG
jgi:hypothetical protein